MGILSFLKTGKWWIDLGIIKNGNTRYISEVCCYNYIWLNSWLSLVYSFGLINLSIEFIDDIVEGVDKTHEKVWIKSNCIKRMIKKHKNHVCERLQPPNGHFSNMQTRKNIPCSLCWCSFFRIIKKKFILNKIKSWKRKKIFISSLRRMVFKCSTKLFEGQQSKCIAQSS